MTKTQERYQTPPEVARRMGVTNNKVLNWIASGQLKASNLSEGSRPRWKIHPDDLQRFLDSKSNQVNVEPKRTRREIPKPLRQWV